MIWGELICGFFLNIFKIIFLVKIEGMVVYKVKKSKNVMK